MTRRTKPKEGAAEALGGRQGPQFVGPMNEASTRRPPAWWVDPHATVETPVEAAEWDRRAVLPDGSGWPGVPDGSGWSAGEKGRAKEALDQTRRRKSHPKVRTAYEEDFEEATIEAVLEADYPKTARALEAEALLARRDAIKARNAARDAASACPSASGPDRDAWIVAMSNRLRLAGDKAHTKKTARLAGVSAAAVRFKVAEAAGQTDPEAIAKRRSTTGAKLRKKKTEESVERKDAAPVMNAVASQHLQGLDWRPPVVPTPPED